MAGWRPGDEDAYHRIFIRTATGERRSMYEWIMFFYGRSVDTEQYAKFEKYFLIEVGRKVFIEVPQRTQWQIRADEKRASDFVREVGQQDVLLFSLAQLKAGEKALTEGRDLKAIIKVLLPRARFETDPEEQKRLAKLAALEGQNPNKKRA